MYAQKPKLSLPGPNDIVRQTLPNGITFLIRENFASPTVVISGYVEAGAADVPPDKIGLARFTTDVMERGTHKRSFAQLYEEVESIAAHFGWNSGTLTSAFGAKGLAEHLPLLLDIINDTLRNPAFEAEQVEKARAEIITAIMERENDTQRMAALTFRTLAYPPEHPLHWSQTGYLKTIRRISRDDLVQFHAQHFAPQGTVIVVVGAVKAKVAAQAIADVFGDWQGQRPPRPPIPAAPRLTECREKRIAIRDKTQSDLILGWPGPARRDPDFIPAFVANTVFGVFGMYGRLGKTIREANGMAYYVYSDLEGGSVAGPWRIIAGVAPSNVAKTVDFIVEELRRLRDTRVPEDELNDSQSYLTGSLPLQLETNEGVAHTLLNIEHHQLGLDYLRRYTDIITSVTAQQIQEVAQRWLDPEHYALAIAEPASR